MKALSVPTTSALAPAHQVPSGNPAVSKILLRLSRQSLLSLVLDWLDDRNQGNVAPYLAREADEDGHNMYPSVQSRGELRQVYTEMQERKGSKRDVVDRIIEGDWHNGISLYQLAMADIQYLYDHPSSQKWTALKIVHLASEGRTSKQCGRSTSMPRFHPATFLQNLQRESLPDVKAHYSLDRHPTLPILILRVYVLDSPYNTSLALQSSSLKGNTIAFDASKTFYVAFPETSPYIYVSLTNSSSTTSLPNSISDNKSLRKLILDGIPKAFSRPRDRYGLEPTSFSARNLTALVDRRGGGRTNAAGGGWSLYAEEKVADTPLNMQLSTPDPSLDGDRSTKEDVRDNGGMKRKREEDALVVKRRRLVAKGRFGNSAKADDGKGIERFDIRLDDIFPSSNPTQEDDDRVPLEEGAECNLTEKRWKGRRSTISMELDRKDDEGLREAGFRPDVRVTFHGSHIFAGIRELVEQGVIDGATMPGWMTGEEGVSVGVVRNGRIKDFKGSGI